MFKNISVLGSGNMGLQIAQEVAYAGLPCVLFDLKTKIVSDNLKSIEDLKITKLARGVPLGGELEYVDRGTIMHALSDRQILKSDS